MSIEALLHDEIETEFETLRSLEPGSDKYKNTVDSLTKLMDRSIELHKVESEYAEKEEARKSEEAFKQKQMKDEKKDRAVKNAIGIGGIVLPLLVTIWGTKVSMKFEETGTFTTIMGRQFINKLFTKK